uniref:Myomodulin-like n=1 Tax=Tritonia tetraquetra TaxID=2780533 RepID=I1SKI0_9GAST|nr:myomodulin-like precursor [Tritonia tetraquetra]
MQVCVLTLIGVIFAFHASCEATKETLSPALSNHELLHKAAPSRVKRGNYDMLRLTRGLNMLRLGKRAGSTDDPEFNSDQILTLEDEYPESYLYQPSPDDYQKALAALNGEYYTSRGLRYRRSTPSDDQMVTAVPTLEEGDVIEDDNMKLPSDLEDEFPSYYPKLAYAVVDDGEGDEIRSKRQWHMLKVGESGDEENNGLKMAEEKRDRLNMLRLGKRQSEEEKKNINMLRLGKRHLNMLRLGKRQLNMLRLGKRQLNMLRLGKRQLNMLRLGKRQLNMLRLGKRQLNMLRLGKRGDNKRKLNMLRLGKRSVDDESDKRVYHF